MHGKFPDISEPRPAAHSPVAIWIAAGGVMLLSGLLFGAGVTVGMLVTERPPRPIPTAVSSPAPNPGAAMMKEFEMMTKSVSEWEKVRRVERATLADAFPELESVCEKLHIACGTQPDGTREFVLVEPLLTDATRQEWWSKLPPGSVAESARSITAIRYTILPGETWISRVELTTAADTNVADTNGPNWQPVPNAGFSSRETVQWVTDMLKQCEDEQRLRKAASPLQENVTQSKVPAGAAVPAAAAVPAGGAVVEIAR